MSVTITMPKQWDKDTAMAILDAYIEGLDRGYILTMAEREGQKMNELHSAFAWVNKLATVQKPVEVSTREEENEEASA